MKNKKSLKKITLNRIKKYLKNTLLKARNLIFNFLDSLIPKSKNIWILPVYFLGDGDFSDNILAFYEKIKNNASVQKIILKRNKNIEINNGKNVKLISIFSWKAVWYLLRAKILIVQHSLSYELMGCKFRPATPGKRIIINLWHGIVVKDLSHPEIGIMNNFLVKELSHHYIITSSEKDKLIMQKVFYPTPKDNFWLTGLPRNDFLKVKENDLPKILQDELTFIKTLKGSKKLIIYTPTYKESRVGGYYYSFDQQEVNALKSFLKANNFILGVRYHLYNQPEGILEKLIDNQLIVDMSARVISNMSVLIREANIIVTDYSSIYIDAMYIKKKLISFAYDFDHYMKKQHGLFYEFNEVFPGEICYTFDDLMKALEKYRNSSTNIDIEKYNKMRKIFFEYDDAKNTERILNLVNHLVFESN